MNGRITHVGGLRGTAVLGVVLFHAGVHDPVMTSGPQTAFSFLARQACHGVDLFFDGALTAGMPFSHLAERPFVRSALRDTLITKIERAFPLVLRHVGIPPAMRLVSTPSRSRELEVVAG
jgi:hypothetical protein